MTNHPNRSKSAALRFVVYSTASYQALAFADSADSALSLCTGPYYGDSDEFYVVFSTRSTDDLSRFDAGRWPSDAKIVFRGENSRAQSYKQST